jgi:hypothetical protein
MPKGGIYMEKKGCGCGKPTKPAPEVKKEEVKKPEPKKEEKKTK